MTCFIAGPGAKPAISRLPSVSAQGPRHPLSGIQDMRLAALLLSLKARLELADDRPDLALRTLQTAYALGRHVGAEPTLICSLVGMAIVGVANSVLEQVLCHPKTPNLSVSLIALPQPFLDMRRPIEGERLLAYANFPGLVEVARDPDAGPLPPEQIEKITKVLFSEFLDSNPDFPQGDRPLLAIRIRNNHEAAKKALIAAGRPREQIEKWPHVQVAVMYALLVFDRGFDEVLKREAVPLWQRNERPAATETGLGQNTRKAATPIVRLLVAHQPEVLIPHVLRARDRLERQFAALRLIEAIRLYAANHGAKLPLTLVDIKEVPLPVCPVTGKSFEYRVEGDKAFLSAPPVPKAADPNIPLLRYEITLRRAEGK